VNLKCVWNTALHEAIGKLIYKGSLLPSTILIGAGIQKYLSVVKTAWSKQMLRCPAGYQIDFVGKMLFEIAFVF